MPEQPEPQGGHMLVVDLDGTLLRSDMLYESFWSALGRDWRSPFWAMRALASGKASLKAYLARAARVDITSLPYDTAVIARIEDWRAKGGRTALVTASDESIAQAVAAHLGLFDEVRGSDGNRNLKGAEKAAYLTGRYGARGYDYMGDSGADLPVWAGAARAITVNAPEGLRRDAERVAPTVEHMTTVTPGLKPYLTALRPHQWLKNILVFLPMLAAHQLDGVTFSLSLLAFVAFCLIASGVYVLNDLLDLRVDRAHPRKSRRPFASGRVPIAHGTLMAPGLLVAGLLLALISPAFLPVLIAYYLLSLGYALYLKRKIVLDICVLAALYTLRIVAGSAATGITLSVWLLAFSIFFFLSLAAVKRQAELVDMRQRSVLKAGGRGYHVDDLPIIAMIAISAGYVSVLVMALYVNAPTVTELYGDPRLLWGVCAVLLYWITRMVMLAHRGRMDDDPVIFAARDSTSRICGLAILGFVLAGSLI